MTAPAAASFVPQGGLPLVLSRAAFVVALLSLAGALVFRVVVMPRVRARSSDADLRVAERALQHLTWSALAVAGAALLAWILLQTAELADAARFGGVVAAIGPVLGDTRFGHVVLFQAAALLSTAWSLGRSRRFVAMVVASAGVAAEAAHGHGMAMEGILGPLFWVEVAHLLAAAGWIGGLLPLLLVVQRAPFRSAAMAARWFSPFGKGCVGVLALSALIEGSALVGGFRPLFETAYGWVVLLKTSCFGVLLALALLNRHRLAPALLGEQPARARRRLIVSVAWQTGTGLLAVVAAGVLSGLTPGMDMGEGS